MSEVSAAAIAKDFGHGGVFAEEVREVGHKGVTKMTKMGTVMHFLCKNIR